MRESLAEARRLQPVSPIRAANVLKSALVQLDDPLIPSAFRNEWSAQLNVQIQHIELGRKLAPPEEINVGKREIKEADRKRAKLVEEEYNEVKRGIGTVGSLVKAGDATQAQKEIDALSKRYGDNPAVMALTGNLSMNQRLKDAQFLVEQQKQGYLVAMRSVDKAAIMPKGDIEYDKEYWLEITKRRLKPLLTKKEESLMKALDTPVNLGYKEAPFEEVLKSISTATGQNIHLDKNALAQAMIESNTPVTITMRGVSARTALRKLLQDHNMTFIIRDEMIQVVTIERVRESLVTRVYYLGDLIQGVGPLGGAAAIQWGPLADMAQTQQNAMQIIDMIKMIDPNSWKDMGGVGTISFNFPSMSVIVRQTAEMQSKLAGSLGR